jgi:hypothetical protein
MGTVERAFQLAPECSSIEELRAKLAKEHFGSIDAHLQGSLRRDLRKLLRSHEDTTSP